MSQSSRIRRRKHTSFLVLVDLRAFSTNHETCNASRLHWMSLQVVVLLQPAGFAVRNRHHQNVSDAPSMCFHVSATFPSLRLRQNPNRLTHPSLATRFGGVIFRTPLLIDALLPTLHNIKTRAPYHIEIRHQTAIILYHDILASVGSRCRCGLVDTSCTRQPCLCPAITVRLRHHEIDFFRIVIVIAHG